MPLVRGAAAAMELLSHAGMSHERPDFGIATVAIDGKEVAVSEEVVASHPFCNLLHFRKDAARDAADAAGRGAALRAFLDLAARHRRNRCCPTTTST